MKSLNILRLMSLEKKLQLKGVSQLVFMKCSFPVSLSKDEEREISQEVEARAVELLIHEANGKKENIFTSRSNTRSENAADILVAAVLSDGTVSEVGVDIEYFSRPITSQVTERITNEKERKLPLSALEFFCVKEACFKAGKNLTPPLKTITEIELISYNVKTHHGTARAGINYFDFGVGVEDSLVAVFAIRRRV